MKNEFAMYQDLKCIWMASSVVEYKLCDKNFDCENCSFDKVIRNYSFSNNFPEKPLYNAAEIVLTKLKEINYDNKLIYLHNSIIIKRIFANTFYLGISPILNSFLDRVSSLKECDTGKYILKDQPIIQFISDWGDITITAPMNFLMYDRMINRSDELSKSRWIAIIGAVQPQIDNCTIAKSDWERSLYNTFDIIDGIKSGFPEVGSTMHDGGEKIKYLYQLIGKSKYKNLLESIIYH